MLGGDILLAPEQMERARQFCLTAIIRIFAYSTSGLDTTCHEWNIPSMACDVEYTDEFADWWGTLSEAEQEDVTAGVQLLEEQGIRLRFPYCSGIAQSRHSHMRELRVQSGGKPLRVFYAFDPRRMAILLIGGDKTGDGRFYERFIPIADRLYDGHIEQLRKEGLLP